MTALKYTDNMILNTDSYKFSHYFQFPPKTETMVYYAESRGGAFPETVMFGLKQIQEFFSKPITMEHITQAETFAAKHGVPFNKEGWLYILEKHNGYIPIAIAAVPEGTVAPIKNVILKFWSTDKNVPWVAGYFERKILCNLWYPVTVASQSRVIKKTLLKYQGMSCTDGLEQDIGFMMNDFGSRGVECDQSSEIGGAAFLLNSVGSDNCLGVGYILDNYEVESFPAYSVIAAEHSTITSWGRENEFSAYKNLAEQAPDGSIISCVSDSYDHFRAVAEWLSPELQSIVKRKSLKLVLRPDSGDPADIVVKTLALCAGMAGYTVNTKGYKVLPADLRVLQGDGIDIDSLETICKAVVDAGFSLENVIFGSGGGLLQKVNRDTMKFAVKCCAILDDGVWRDVYKQPVTDSGKKSKAGMLDLVIDSDNNYVTITNPDGVFLSVNSELELIYKDGEVFESPDSYDTVRERASQGL